MVELPPAEYFKLQELFGIIIKEMNGRLTPDEAIVKFHRAAQAKCLSIFVDSDKPKHCLILSHYPGIVDSGFVCAIIMMYSLPTARNRESLNAMRSVYTEYAKKHDCDVILGSAWKWKGSRGIDSVWTEDGFELQETVYAKQV